MPATPISFLKAWLNRIIAWMARLLPGRELATGEAGITVYLLPAHNGDAFLIEFGGDDGESHFIWVDGGLVRSYHEELKSLLMEFPKNKDTIDLMVVTHIDADHIGGILAFVEDQQIPKDFVKQFWFNSGRTLDRMFGGNGERSRDIDLQSLMGTRSRSISQGEKLEDFLTKHGGWHDIPIQAGQAFALYGAQLTLLSPNETSLRQLHSKWETESNQAQSRSLVQGDHNKSLEELAQVPEDEDDAVPNGSSIAFIFELANQRILLLGDSHPSDIVKALADLGYTSRRPLHLTAVKLSHHASRRSISQDLLSVIRCNHYFVSTDGSRHGLPDKETFAKILLHPKRNRKQVITFTFNYSNEFLRELFTEEEKQRHQFQCIYPEAGQKGMWIDL